MTNVIAKYATLLKQYGLANCLSRLIYDVKRHRGLIKRRFPCWQWAQRPLAFWLKDGVPCDVAAYRSYADTNTGAFFFPLGKPPMLDEPWGGQAVAAAGRILRGEFPYFSNLWGRLGYPEPAWLTNPFTGQSESASRHWCDLRDFDPARGDIKFLWEPSRFSWAWPLVRAYAATGDDRYAQAFWTLFESWLECNPPHMGPNWLCGQEVSIRIIACAFATRAFWASPATTDARVAAMAVFMGASAQRVAGNIDFALWQKSNHAVTEAAGVFTVGMLWPELKDAPHWRRLGRHVLLDQCRRYNWPDGSYVMHSFNYQRMSLQVFLWCMRLAQLAGEPMPAEMSDRIRLSTRFLYQLQDAAGRCPNYGSNDGALLLPLNGCDYLDYRPALGALHYLLEGKPLYTRGPWSEDLVWLFGREAADAPPQALARTSCDFTYGGYYTLRGRDTWAMIRCHSYRSRPGQADLLAVDLWWKGVNVLRDSGTFSYYDPQGQWNNYFLSTTAHNTVQIGGQDQMIKGPRFQWQTLAQSRLLGRRGAGDVEIWQGEHYGYRRLSPAVVHRRTLCRLGDQAWLVVDDLLGSGAVDAKLFWHLTCDGYDRHDDVVYLQTPAGEVTLFTACSGAVECTMAQGQESSLRLGWQSLYYGRRTPALAMQLASLDQLPLRYVTVVGLAGRYEITQCLPDHVVAWRGGEGVTTIDLLPPPEAGVIRRVAINGTDVWQQSQGAGGESV
ncbi:MAG: heparinase II/III family protein [Planctomycetaceae bacterium]|nr:heparinase II/III family protein [Planctomycetaceae bacterium]